MIDERRLDDMIVAAEKMVGMMLNDFIRYWKGTRYGILYDQNWGYNYFGGKQVSDVAGGAAAPEQVEVANETRNGLEGQTA